MKVILTEKEICPKCGAKFDCGKSGKCWCYEYDVSPGILEKINNNYDSCLCPGCLEALSRGKAELEADQAD